MGFFEKVFNRVNAPDKEAVARITGHRVNELLMENDVCGERADCVYIHKDLAMVWRRFMAERLGQEVCRTPMPGDINGVQVILCEGDVNKISFERKINEKWAKKVFDVTQE